jgi:autotransporter translocation and assembly factor TamB
MKNAFLYRVPDRRTAIVLLRDTLAVVQIELEPPLSQDDFLKAQSVNAMAPLPVDVDLGPYDMPRFRFANCSMSAEFKEVNYQRVDYRGLRQRRSE